VIFLLLDQSLKRKPVSRIAFAESLLESLQFAAEKEQVL